MKKINCLLFLFLFLLFSPLYADSNRIVISDILYAGSDTLGSLRDSMKNSIINIINTIPEFTCVPDSEYAVLMKAREYELSDLFDDLIVNQVMKGLYANYCVVGQYIERSNSDSIDLFITIFTQAGQKYEYHELINHYNKTSTSIAIQKRIQSIINDFISKVFDSTGKLIIYADPDCDIFLNGKQITAAMNNIRLKTGLYNVLALHEDKAHQRWEGMKTVFVKEDEMTEVDMRFVSITITAGVECSVLIDGKLMGQTPFQGKLLNNREYLVEVFYTDLGAKNHNVYKEVIYCKDEDIPPIDCSVSGTITINGPNTNLVCRLNNEKILPVPCESEPLPVGTYEVELLLEYITTRKYFVLDTTSVELFIDSPAVVDFPAVTFHYNWGLCFIPGAAQIHNYEPAKGAVLAGLTTLLGAGGGVLLYMSYDMRNQVDSGEISKDNLVPVTILYGLSIGCFSLAGAVYLYSFIDGWVTMDHMYHIIHDPEYMTE